MSDAGDDPRLKDALAACEAIVRAEDPDRATATLFAPPAARAALHALYAFDIETATIRDKVRQPMPGEIRLQWWRDVVTSRDASGQGSPVAAALLAAIEAHDLPRDAFERLLEARIFDLYDDPMPSREAFETYAGETASAIVVLAAMVLDRGRASQAAALAGHAGVALTADRVLRTEERLRNRGQVYVPAEMLDAVGLDALSYLAGRDPERVRSAMTAFAREHRSRILAGWSRLPQTLRPAFLPVRAVDLSGQERGTARPRLEPLTRTISYWWAMRQPREAGSGR